MVNLIGLVTSPIPDIASTIIGILDILIALVGVFIGIKIVTRLGGKLKSAFICLILAITVIIIREVMIISGVTTAAFIVGLMRVVTVLLIFAAILFMKKMVDGIDNHLREREKKAGSREVAVGEKEKALRRK